MLPLSLEMKGQRKKGSGGLSKDRSVAENAAAS